MSRLHIPAVHFIKDQASRYRTGPAFFSYPRQTVFQGNRERRPCHSFNPAPAARPSGSQSRLPTKASHPSIHSHVPEPPTSRSRLEERRAARQARPRPWLPAGKSVVAHPPHFAPTSLSAAAPASIRKVDLVKPAISKVIAGRNKTKTVKRVRFGDATTVTVDRWIDWNEHVFPNPPRVCGRLEGWDVKVLEKPDENGETCKYTTYWGSGFSGPTYSHTEGPCGRYGCAWNQLADIEHRWEQQGVRLCTEDLFRVWELERENIRKCGGFAL